MRHLLRVLVGLCLTAAQVEVAFSTTVEVLPAKELQAYYSDKSVFPQASRYFAGDYLLEETVIKPYIRKNSATRERDYGDTPNGAASTLLRINGSKFITRGSKFIPRRSPDERCTLNFDPGAKPYACKEGQPFYESCHLFFVNDRSELKAVHEFKIRNFNSDNPAFCNWIAAVGSGSKDKGILLVTLQFFDIGGPVAKTVQELGSGWNRSTFVLRVEEKDGELTLTQDDSCLGNPNRYETIAAARKALNASACK